MTAIAHFVAIFCYVGAAALAATPFARPVGAPVRGVVVLLAAGVLAHLTGLIAYARLVGQLPLTGLGPSLSFAGLVLATTLLVVELLARDVSLTLVTAPLAAVPTLCANSHAPRAPGCSTPGAKPTRLAQIVGTAASGAVTRVRLTSRAMSSTMSSVAASTSPANDSAGPSPVSGSCPTARAYAISPARCASTPAPSNATTPRTGAPTGRAKGVAASAAAPI